VLEANDVAYALAGGMAANLYRSEVRATEDIDLSIKVRALQIEELSEAFRAAGWKVEPTSKACEQLRLSREGFPRVDCLVAATDLEASAIARASTVSVGGRPLRVLRPEDLLVLKLIAGRARDYDAAGNIINELGSQLDAAYITGWLDQFGMAERWQLALEEAERQRTD